MEHGRLAASAPSWLPSTCQRTQNKAALAVRSSLVLPLIEVSPVFPPFQGRTFQSAEQEFHQPIRWPSVVYSRRSRRCASAAHEAPAVPRLQEGVKRAATASHLSSCD